MNVDRQILINSYKEQKSFEAKEEIISKELMRLRVEAESFQTLNNWLSNSRIIDAMAAKNGISVDALAKKMGAVYESKKSGLKTMRANAYRNLVAHNVEYAKKINGFVAAKTVKEVEMFA